VRFRNLSRSRGEPYPHNINKNKRILDNLLTWARAELEESESRLDKETLKEYIADLEKMRNEME